MTPRHLITACTLAIALGSMAACSSTSTSDNAKTPSTSSPAAAPSPTTTPPPRVADLLAAIGCGTVIPTQLYSRETGRCGNPDDGKQITIATFDTASLRDQWVNFGRQLGGSIATGEGWAAWCSSPDDARMVAGKLHGTVL